MEKIRAYFQQMTAMPEQDWSYFRSRLQRVELPRKACLLRTGATEHYLSFIEAGTVRYYMPGEELDLTFAFAFANQFVSAYDSFLTREPAAYEVETLTPAILWRLSYDDLQDIYRDTGVGNLIGRLAAEDIFMKKARRELSLLKDTAEERYLEFMELFPNVMSRVPLWMVATHLGMTAESLSRVRKELAKKKTLSPG